MIKPSDVALPNYSSIFKGFDETETFSFMSTINFFEDLFICSEELKNYENKGEKLKEYLRQMNSKLPSCVYIPFTKSKANPNADTNLYYNVLNIVVDETRIFSTKMRAPFYVCLEVFSPIEGFPEVPKENYFRKINRPITLKVAHL